MKSYYTLNEHYFDTIDCNEKAYWLGFLFADGATVNTSNIIYFGQIKDRIDTVIAFKSAISLTKEINIRIPKVGNTYYFCEFCSKIMANKLKELGCVPQKSLLGRFNSSIVPEKYMNAFIRGYFDGDGCIWEGKRKIMLVKDKERKSGERERIVHNVKFTITGNYEFINELQNYLCKQLGFKKTKLNFSKAKTKKHICTMEYSGRKQIQSFFDYIYKDATVYEKSKRKKFENIICAFTEKSVIETALTEGTPEMATVNQAA